MPTKYDFSGWATRSNIQCSDGRIIANDAFKDNDGQKVPLVWSHNHNDPNYVLGHALLENRGDGVYAYCSFNSSENGQNAKLLVEHGDVESLSIYANQLTQDGSMVSHGNIREVSLVLAGANPGAYIENTMSHSGTAIDDEAIIHTADEEVIDPTPGEFEEQEEPEDDQPTPDEEEKAEEQDEEKEEKEPEEPETELDEDDPEGDEEEDQMPEEKQELSHADDSGNEGKTVQEVFNTLTDEQKDVVYFLIGEAVKEAGGNVEGNTEGGEGMKHNVFEGDENYVDEAVLSHDAMEAIFNDAKSSGSLRDSVLKHSAEYGIENIEWLFPEHKNLKDVPDFIKKVPDAWVQTVMNGVSKTPFSRIRMVFADITADQARARGYTKGNRKIEEVFTLLRRKVGPTTIYKKQKLDRDDIIDITDFDVVAWMKTEMRMMLDEEIARAILFSDGRSPLAEDKIKEDCIIPVINDDSLYTITKIVTPAEGQSEEEALLDAAVLAGVDYQGSGNKTAFMRPEQTAKIMLLQDGFKHRLYKDANEVALAMNVKKIEEVPASVMTDDTILSVILDLKDYTVGADKGGAINMFDDFDIDYNQEKYLIETRCSGALTKPYSAIVLKKAGDGNSQPSEPVEPDTGDETQG